MTLMNVILADSSTQLKPFFNRVNNSDLAKCELVQENNYELFKSKMLVRIKSTVKTVLVIFCDHGLAFIK